MPPTILRLLALSPVPLGSLPFGLTLQVNADLQLFVTAAKAFFTIRRSLPQKSMCFAASTLGKGTVLSATVEGLLCVLQMIPASGW